MQKTKERCERKKQKNKENIGSKKLLLGLEIFSNFLSFQTQNKQNKQKSKREICLSWFLFIHLSSSFSIIFLPYPSLLQKLLSNLLTSPQESDRKRAILSRERKSETHIWTFPAVSLSRIGFISQWELVAPSYLFASGRPTSNPILTTLQT